MAVAVTPRRVAACILEALLGCIDFLVGNNAQCVTNLAEDVVAVILAGAEALDSVLVGLVQFTSSRHFVAFVRGLRIGPMVSFLLKRLSRARILCRCSDDTRASNFAVVVTQKRRLLGQGGGKLLKISSGKLLKTIFPFSDAWDVCYALGVNEVPAEPSEDDADIVALLKNREERGLQMAMARYAGLIVRTLGFKKRDNELDLEDAMMIVIEKIWKSSDRLRADRSNSFRSWVTQIAKNVRNDMLRSKKRRSLMADVPEEDLQRIADPTDSDHGERGRAGLLLDLLNNAVEMEKFRNVLSRRERIIFETLYGHIKVFREAPSAVELHAALSKAHTFSTDQVKELRKQVVNKLKEFGENHAKRKFHG